MPFNGRYRPFNIAVEPVENGPIDISYRVQVLDSPQGQSEDYFNLPPTLRDEWAGRRLSPEEIGATLFDALFGGPVGQLLRASQARAADEAGLRINLRLSHAPELAQLPWETLYDNTHQRFLALSQRTPINRYLALPLAEESLSVEAPLRVLALLSAPDDYKPRLDVETEFSRLQAALAQPIQAGQMVLEKLDSPTWSSLQNHLREEPVHILHFVGHGYFDGQAQTGGLVFEDDNGHSREIAARQLASLLHNHSALRLVVLNACDGAAASSVDPFTGVAQTLVQQGQPAVIAMQRAISDRAGILFGESFYASLADGYPIDAALTQARVALYGADSPEWATPVLFLRSDDGSLFPGPESESRPEDENENTPIHWHLTGAVWLAAGLVGLLLLVGLGQLYLQGNPVLQGVVGAMVALAASLLGLLGIRNDRTLFPRLSHSMAALPTARWGVGSLLALSIGLWATWGIGEIRTADCHPILGCKPQGEEWFAVAEWQASGDLTPLEKRLAANIRHDLHHKLNLVDGLIAIDLSSPQLGDKAVEQLDIWLAGDYQSFAARQLSAQVTRGGRLLDTVVVEENVDPGDEAEAVCLLELQNRLALRILAVLDIPVTQELEEAMMRVPTASCAALRLNNQAADLVADGDSLLQAQVLLEEALGYDPNYADAYSNLGRVFHLRGEYVQAIGQFQRAIEILPSDALYHANLAQTHEALGDFTAAAVAYAQAASLARTDWRIYNNLGYAYLQLGRLDDAENALAIGLELASDRPELYKNRGRLLLERDEPDLALAALEKAIAISSDYAEAYYYLALAQHALDRSEDACNTLLFDYFELVPEEDVDPERFTQAETLYLSEWQCE